MGVDKNFLANPDSANEAKGLVSASGVGRAGLDNERTLSSESLETLNTCLYHAVGGWMFREVLKVWVGHRRLAI